MYRPPHGKRDRNPLGFAALLIVGLALLALGVVGVFVYRVFFMS